MEGRRAAGDDGGRGDVGNEGVGVNKGRKGEEREGCALREVE